MIANYCRLFLQRDKRTHVPDMSVFFMSDARQVDRGRFPAVAKHFSCEPRRRHNLRVSHTFWEAIEPF